VIIVIVGVVIFKMSQKTAPKFETAAAEPATISDVVSVTGNVQPVAEASFGFQTTGTVKSIPVVVGQHVSAGDLIASLSDDATYASLLGAQASLQEAQANLADNQTNTQIAYTNAQKSAVASVADAYNKVQNAVVQNLNTLFSNSQSGNPTLLVQTQTYSEERQIEMEQVAVIQALQNWKTEINSASSTSAETLLTDTQTYLNTVTTFSTSLAAAVNQFSANASTNAQSVATADLATVNTADATIVSAVSEVTSAGNALSSATPQSIAALEAKVAEAEATVANWQAQYNESKVTAPFDGVITEIDPQVGDLISANTVEFSEMSDQQYKVEVNVPETDITNINVGDPANITLDAFGDSVIFPATVTEVDPAETVIEGVPTYKVTLMFVNQDSRIRSGMTANIDITAATIPNVLAIPFRAIIDTNGSTTVQVIAPDGVTLQSIPVVVGLKGSDGMVQVISGIATGTAVVTYNPAANSTN
jgi:HlyD family secretion protein